MKQKLAIILCFVAIVMCYGCTLGADNQSYLRIHIRANSNADYDQNIKYQVKDIVVTYLTPYVKDCGSIDEVKILITSKANDIENLIDNFLADNGFSYTSNVKINNEFFPTRSYDGLTLQADYYDAVIVELGKAEGNNWWCVVYPPLCFSGDNVVYKSKIVELINKYLK